MYSTSLDPHCPFLVKTIRILKKCLIKVVLMLTKGYSVLTLVLKKQNDLDIDIRHRNNNSTTNKSNYFEIFYSSDCSLCIHILFIFQ